MDAAVRFYTEVLGLKLANRFGNHWATVLAGNTLLIGLHRWKDKYPRPGTKGSVQIGLIVSHGETIQQRHAPSQPWSRGERDHRIARGQLPCLRGPRRQSDLRRRLGLHQ
jgi:catechol 2,3-dioxygenase-like lactoylglutathione lyase family enzyme